VTPPNQDAAHGSGPAAAIALLLLACGLVCLLVWDQPAFLCQADPLLPAALVWDLTHLPDAWSHFQMPRVPSFFPDLLLIGVPQTLTGNWRIGMMVWVFGVTAWLAALVAWIASRIARVTFAAALPPALALIATLLAAGAIGFPWFTTPADYAGFAEPFLVLLLPYSHGGAFLLALTAAAMASMAGVAPARLAGVFILSAAATVSDLLTVTTLLVPLTAALAGGMAAGTASRASAGVRLAAAWGGGVCGVFLLSLLPARQAMPATSVLVALVSVLRGIAGIASQPIVLALLGFTGFTILRRRRSAGWRSLLGDFWTPFAVVSMAASLAIMLPLYFDVWCFRYAGPLLWWPVILLAATLAPRAPRRWRPALVLPAFTIALILAAAMRPVPRLLTWLPPQAICLRDAGLRAGLAYYGTARPVSAGTEWRIHTDQITGNGAAYLWGNDPRWFTRDIHDPAKPPSFSFIVMDLLNPGAIAATYGKPARILPCGASTIWVYDDPAAVDAALRRASPWLQRP